jgi:outer membrane autotransporter protein
MELAPFARLRMVFENVSRYRNSSELGNSPLDNARCRSWRLLDHALLVVLALMITTPKAYPQAFVVTLEAPKVQQSSLSTNPTGFGATNVIVETFDELKPGFILKPVPFAANAALGSYDHLLVSSADNFGGAGGKGNYITVSNSKNDAVNPTTLTLTAPQRYFGFWWSAGDAKDVISFYSGNTLVETFSTSEIINFIDTQGKNSGYNGNPNNGKANGQPFAFLNFYADPSNPGVTFDRIVFSNEGSGFQADNDTIATIYTDISGMDINPATPVDLGGSPNSTDTKGVEGPDSTLTDSGDAIIGGSGDGTLNVIDGGTVSDGATTIGQNPGSTGTVDVTGPGSNLTDKGNAVIGQGGSGTLDVTNGGTVTDTNATVGAQAGSSGIAIVDGAGSEWDNTGTLDIGPVGSGVVEVLHAGTIVAHGGTTLGPNGVLAGDGTITTPTLINNGIVIPTGPTGTPGTLAVIGNYQQGSTGVLDAEIGGPEASQADQLKVNGSAKLDGTLDITSLNNFHPSSGNSYELLSASGGLSGEFSNIADSANTNGLSRLDIYGPNGLLVTYLPPGLGDINLSTSKPLPATLNAGNLNAFLISLLDPNVEQLTAPFEIWFSEATTQRFNIENRFDDIIAGSTGFVSNVNDPTPAPTGKEVTEGKGVVVGKEIKEAPPSPLQPAPGNRWGVWVTGFGDFVNVDNEGSVQGYNFTNGGVTIGVDYRLTDNVVIGLMGGYAHSWTDLNPSGTTDVNTGWGGGYAGYFGQGLYIDGAIFGGADSFSTTRATFLGGSATGNSSGYVFSTFAAGGYDFHLGQLTIGPTAALQYSSEEINSFTEHGSFVPLNVSSDIQDSLTTDLGFRGWYDVHFGQIGVRPFVRAAWQHEFLYSALPISASLVNIPGPPATFFSPSLGHDSAVVNAGVSVQWTRSFSTYVSYDGQLGRSNYNSNGVSGGFAISF